MAVRDRHAGWQYLRYAFCGVKLSSLSFRGAKRRGNLAGSGPITGKPRRKRNCLPEIAPQGHFLALRAQGATSAFGLLAMTIWGLLLFYRQPVPVVRAAPGAACRSPTTHGWPLGKTFRFPFSIFRLHLPLRCNPPHKTQAPLRVQRGRRLSKNLSSRKFRREEKCERKPSGFPFAFRHPPQRQNCKIILQNLILQF